SPADPNTVYIGNVNGGIWKTQHALWGVDGVDNDGDHLIDSADPKERPNWTPLTDQLPSLSITALAVDPLNPQIVWAGTGQASSAYVGQTKGLLKSDDRSEEHTSELQSPDHLVCR